MSEPVWTEARVAELRRLWNEDGLSAGQIAKRFGLTRNAVVGKAHREGLIKREAGAWGARSANVSPAARYPR